MRESLLIIEEIKKSNDKGEKINTLYNMLLKRLENDLQTKRKELENKLKQVNEDLELLENIKKGGSK